jgi:hypothetical protein
LFRNLQKSVPMAKISANEPAAKISANGPADVEKMEK